MLILSVDTSTLNSSVSISEDLRTLTEIIISSKVVLSEKLLHIIDELLKSCCLDIRDLGLIAVGLGPGSFTGLRVGLSTVKGIAFPLNIPVVGYSTLEVLPYNCRNCSSLIVPMLDARKGEVYAAAYRFKSETVVEVRKKSAVKPSDFMRNIKEKTVFLGEGAAVYRNVIEEFMGEKAIFGVASENYPKSSYGAIIALNEFVKSGADKLDSLEPFYLRRSEAEIKFNKIKESNVDNLKQMFYKS